MRKRVAITGASGFVGKYLVTALEGMGNTVTRLSRDTTDYSLESLIASLDGIECVIHLAGRRMTREDVADDLSPFAEPNVLLSGRLMEAAKTVGAERFVFASTIAVYSPEGPMPYRESTSTAPINAYALSKKMAEDYLALKVVSDGPLLITLRLAALYGDGEKGTPALMRFINQARMGHMLTLAGNANYGIDQLYVRDAVNALIAAIAPEAAAGTYNIGAGRLYTIRTLAETVNEAFGNSGNLDSSAADDGPERATYMTISKAKTGLNWQPTYDLRRGLKDLRETRLIED